MARIAIIGGTGPEGIGLAMRFAQAGEEIVLGSRDAAGAGEAAARVASRVPGARLRGALNSEAAQAGELIVLALPLAGADAFATEQSAALAGKIVVDVMVPLRFDRGVCLVVPIAEGSLGQMLQHRMPAARVVSAFKNLSAEHLHRLERPLEGDVLVCGDDVEAKKAVAALAERLPGLRAVDAGPISSAAALEAITVMLLNINRRYGALTSVKIVGLGKD